MRPNQHLCDTFGVGNKTVSAGEIVKGVFRYKANDFRSAITGTLQNQDSSGSLPTVDRLYLGSNWSGTGNFLNSHMQQFAYWNQILPDWRLLELSRV